MFNEAELRAHADGVNAQAKIVGEIEAKFEQAQSDAANVDGSAGALTTLRRQREEALGRAYIAGADGKADTKTIDAEIARLEKSTAEARARALAAQAAVPLLEAERDAAVSTLTVLSVAQLEAARDQVRAA